MFIISKCIQFNDAPESKMQVKICCTDVMYRFLRKGVSYTQVDRVDYPVSTPYPLSQ